jgi:hypothetical protein
MLKALDIKVISEDINAPVPRLVNFNTNGGGGTFGKILLLQPISKKKLTSRGIKIV